MRRWLVATVVIVLVCGAVAAAVGLRRHDTGWFAPVFSADGRAVIAIRRDVSAWVVGLGYELVSPPAHVRITSDRFSIWSIDPDSGRSHEIAVLPPPPSVSGWYAAYRPRLFGNPSAAFEWRDGSLHVTVGLTRHAVPSAETWIAKGVLTPDGSHVEPWQRGSAPSRSADPATLHGPLEVVAVPGDAMPCGIAIIDSRTRSVKALELSAGCQRRYGSAPALADVESASHRAAIERSQMLERTYAALVDQHRARGESDVNARLDAIRDMRRLGHYPPVPQLTARPLPPGEAAARKRAGTLSPLFAIAEEEFVVGLFPDLERALDRPGRPVEKQIGRYIRHDRFATSGAINDFLAGGGHQFFVERQGRTFMVTLDMGTP